MDPGILSRGDHAIPLAVIGISTRFAQEATDGEKFWDLLLRARQAATPFPKDRFNSNAFYHPDPEHGGTFHVKGAHFLSEDPLGFDAPFFNVNKTEVLTLDPQQRVAMENVYHALENAGIPMEKVIGSKTSVIAAGFNHDHMALMDADPEVTLKHKPTGSQQSILSNRISWFYDFSGPSITIDTACSSGIVAVHLAAQSLKSGDSEMAIVTGGSIITYVPDIIAMSHSGFLGPEGKCFSFDHRAEGYGRGEGVGSIVIKTLESAIRDGDTIRAVIRASGVNQDGRTPGITLPSSKAQSNLIREVYSRASLDPNITMFVEAHGTGTAAGDPIEAQGIADGFGSTRRNMPLHIGALKANIGHLEGGAGIAGVIKSIMILESGIIPPNVNLEKVNPKIPTDEWNIHFPTECIPWPRSGLRRVSVNSFGFGGTNAHCVLDDAFHFLKENGISGIHNTRELVPTKIEIQERLSALKNAYANRSTSVANLIEEGNLACQMVKSLSTNELAIRGNSKVRKLFLLSASDQKGIHRVAMNLCKYLTSKQDLESETAEALLNDLAYTLSERRSRLRWKSYLLADSMSTLKGALADEKVVSKPTSVRHPPKLGFVFTGQGAQYCRMGQQLLVYPAFRESLQQASEYMKALGSPWSLLDEVLKDKENSRISMPEFSHPACTALQIAIVDLLSSWGIVPVGVLGHSSGEIPAAYCAGRISREAAWKASYYRGYVSAKETNVKGSMVAVGLDQEKLRPYLEKVHALHGGELIIACYNAPKNNTVAGDETMVDTLKMLLDEDGVFSRKLNVPKAYHTAHMKSVSEEYLELMGNLPPGAMLSCAKSISMFSSVTGKEVEDLAITPSYWVDNMISPVRFTEGLRSMLFQEIDGKSDINTRFDEIVEIGPHGALQSAIKEIISTASLETSISYSSVLDRNEATTDKILICAGKLSCKAFPVDLLKVNSCTNSGTQQPRLLVDLPPYSFNHDEKGYYESRLTKNLRFREFPRHQLLGAPVQDWTRLSRRWRHFFRCSENPWLRDHVITDSYVFPGAGYLTMALEAVKQTAGEAVQITGIRFKDVNIKSALVIPDTNAGVEVCLSVSPVNESNEWASTVWKFFQVSSYIPSFNDWVDNCTGYIALEYESSGPDLVGNGREGLEAKLQWQRALDQASETCGTALDAGKIFENFETIGLKYGPSFRNLSNVAVSGQRKGTFLGEITVPELNSIMPKGYIHPHLIHPATLDSTLVAGLVAICDNAGQTVLKRPMVPTFIKEAWISAATSSQPGSQLHCFGEASVTAYESYDFNARCWDAAGNDPRILLSGVRFKPLTAENVAHSTQITYGMDWKPSINMLETPEFLGLVPVTAKTPFEKQQDSAVKLQLATILLITDGLEDLKTNPPPSPLEGHLKIYFDWMERVVSELNEGSLLHVPLELWKTYSADHKLKEELYRSIGADFNTDGQILLRLGSHIAAVVRQEIDPLYLMFGQDDLMPRHYEEVILLNDSLQTVQEYLSIVRENFNGLEILEVGSGTGSFTKLMLKSLCPRSQIEKKDEISNISKYTFTDISPSFFSKAKDRLEQWKDILAFQKLDIGSDPLNQGFSAGKYDLIVANNVLHATPNLQRTLEHCRLLLKPGGKLLVQEGVRPELHWVSLVFGQLPGWWLSIEPERKWCPYITEPEWNGYLNRAGFSGLDVSIPSSHYPEFSQLSTMISTAVVDSSKGIEGNIKEVIILCYISAHDVDVVARLKAEVTPFLGGINCFVMQPCDLDGRDVTDSICISLLELEEPLLFDIIDDDFQLVQRLLSTCRKLLWVTGDSNEEPAFNMINGLIRSIRWERDADNLNFTTVAMADARSSPAKDVAHSLAKVFRYQFLSGQTEHGNAEYFWRDKMVYTNRITSSPAATDFLVRQFSTPAPELTRWKDVKRAVRLENGTPGLLDKLQWVTDTTPLLPLGDSEVEIDVRAVGLNFVDLLTVMGELPWDVVGREGAGVVTRVGPAVRWIQPGDRVVYLVDTPKKGTFQTYSRVNETVVARIPNDMSFEVAAALPVNYATVIYSLTNVGRLAAGESVLIHSAAGGVGQAAVQYAMAIGAEVFATVSTPEKKEFLMREYGVLEDHIFSSRNFSFVKGIKRLTGNVGVDVVLNSLSREALRRSWECLAPFGRFIEIGKKDLIAGGKLDMSPFLRNITFAGVDLLSLAEHKPRIVQQLLQETLRRWEEKTITGARPNTELSYAQLEEGMRRLQSGKQMGKIVFTPQPEDLIPVVPETPPPYTFAPDASYILAGGLGGIGRSLAKWMVSRGARSLIFLSRSGNITEPVAEMMASVESRGCSVKVFKCDVADVERLREVVEECGQTLPPVRGCIQCSMILRDGLFENMSFADWVAVTKPKVHGSLNLHHALPASLDFFLMLSSVGGIMGARSQANYSAANTYEDALARSLVARGVRAASVNLGSVLSVGFVAENKDYTRHVAKTIGAMREDEVHAIVEYLIDPRCPLTASTCQVIFGLNTVRSFRDRGMPAPECFNYPLFNLLRDSAAASGDHGARDAQVYHVQALLAAARNRAEATDVVAGGILRKLAVLLNVPADQIEAAKSIRANGVDSLIAMEFRTWLAKELGAEIPLIELMAEASIHDLSTKVSGLSKFVQQG
ncbi:hypothetical protein LOZ36_003157 [Ophidiomyces ophidiicola]|nr:hypothetical protein LOZ36_003157 [Ophidiomyces ophidiicola]